jgi:hypothetical protein
VVTEERHVTKETDMKLIKVLTWTMWSLVFTLTALPGLAADYPAPQEGSWVARLPLSHRRGGKWKSFTWEQFSQMLDRVKIARPRIIEVRRRRVVA